MYTGVRVMYKDPMSVAEKEDIINRVIEEAQKFWKPWPNDFGICSWDDEGITFGIHNRVTWRFDIGFYLIEMNCTPQFIDHYHSLQE